MADLKLTGLKANSAHGFLAALGVMEALHAMDVEARLSWSDDFFPHAVLSTSTDYESLVVLLLKDRDQRLNGAVLNYPPSSPFATLGCSAGELTEWARVIGDLPNNHPDIDQWCGLVIEGGLTATGNAKPTHFDFSAGQVKFLRVVRTLAQALDAAMLENTLLGPWRYADSLSTLRYDSDGERLGALRGIPPDKDPRGGVPGADWFAFRGLACYPLTLAAGRDRARVVTAACDADWNRSAFRWPVWTEPLGRPALRAVVTDPRIIGEALTRRITEPNRLVAFGIHSVWQSAILRSSQGYGSFGPAKQIAISKAGRRT